jgi:hypothetical protein
VKFRQGAFGKLAFNFTTLIFFNLKFIKRTQKNERTSLQANKIMNCAVEEISGSD